MAAFVGVYVETGIFMEVTSCTDPLTFAQSLDRSFPPPLSPLRPTPGALTISITRVRDTKACDLRASV